MPPLKPPKKTLQCIHVHVLVHYTCECIVRLALNKEFDLALACTCILCMYAFLLESILN